MKVSNTYSKRWPLNDGHYVVILLLFCTFMNHLDEFGSCCENMAGFISPLSKTFNLKAQNTDTADVQVITYVS